MRTRQAIVWDAQAERVPSVCQVARELGLDPQIIGHPSLRPQLASSPDCFLALVGIGAQPVPQSPGWSVVQELKSRGFQVIAYEQGARDWPLRVRCAPLLAGAVDVLDSSDAGFRGMLRELLDRLIRAELRRQLDDEELAAVMRRHSIVGNSSALMAVGRLAVRFASLSDLPVLITGETGTGKELLARLIHALDLKRRGGRFVAVNCGAISPALAESELFGHRRGAFTGAERERPGLIRAADGGVLFLDEIGELPEALQPKLLRVLQEGRVLGVGEDHDRAVSVRVLAATHRDLAGLTGQNRFRPDLFHRLNVLPLHLPPLRDRPTDVAPLVAHFLDKYRSLHPRGSPSVSREFVEALQQSRLPGNARQVENLVRQALINQTADAPLGLRDLPASLWHELSAPPPTEVTRDPVASPTPPPSASAFNQLQGPPLDLAELLGANDWKLSRCLEQCERRFLEAAMRRAGGNQSAAARLLGLTPRSVYTKLHKFHLVNSSAQPGAD